jgi:hypothetical protein
MIEVQIPKDWSIQVLNIMKVIYGMRCLMMMILNDIEENKYVVQNTMNQ